MSSRSLKIVCIMIIHYLSAPYICDLEITSNISRILWNEIDSNVMENTSKESLLSLLAAADSVDSIFNSSRTLSKAYTLWTLK